jgi:hypothetical protein
MGVTTNG